jgi:hypothetical protein
MRCSQCEKIYSWSMIFFRKPASTHGASTDARERAFDQARGQAFRDHALVRTFFKASGCARDSSV